jgi:Flp pilus assembly protein TadG
MMLRKHRGTVSLARAGRRQDGERGQILVLFTLVVVLLMVLASVVIDVGLFRTDGARLQNALDSAALAAAQSLPANQDNVDEVRQTAADYTDANYPGLAAPTTGFACLIGVDANGLPRVTDMPSICKVSFAANNANWRCTGLVCWAPCDPSTVATDACNTVIVADSATRPYTFGRAVGINSANSRPRPWTWC